MSTITLVNETGTIELQPGRLERTSPMGDVAFLAVGMGWSVSEQFAEQAIHDGLDPDAVALEWLNAHTRGGRWHISEDAIWLTAEVEETESLNLEVWRDLMVEVMRNERLTDESRYW